MKNVLIIGSDGYIGSRLCEDFKEKYWVTKCDMGLFSTPQNSWLCNYNELDKKDISYFDAIVLLAGHSSVPMCLMSEPSDVIQNNVNNFISLFENVKSVKNIYGKNIKLIYASSSSVYGSGDFKGVEDLEKEFYPMNIYDWTKYVCDVYAKGNNEVEYYGLRFGTVNGYSPKTRNDIMINSMYYSILQQGNFNITRKKTRRAILGITDLSKAISTIIDSEEDKRGIYNLASFNATVEEIAIRLSKLSMKSYIENKEEIHNTKNYDFYINSSKFCEAFNFRFKENVETIYNELEQNKNNITFTNRNQAIKL